MANSESAPDASTVEGLRNDLAALGLAGNEAAVLLALFRLGGASAAQIAAASGIGRTNTYRVIEALEHRGLIHRAANIGVATWVSERPEEVVGRLERDYRRRAGELATQLMQWASPLDSAGLPKVRVIHDPEQAAATFETLVLETERELVMFTRPPYSTIPRPSPAVLDLLAREAQVRVIYDAADVVNLETYAELERYHQAGVQGRVLDRLPMKLAVFDRTVALFTVANAVVPTAGFPTALHVDDVGFADLLADGFELRWADASPYEPSLGAPREVT